MKYKKTTHDGNLKLKTESNLFKEIKNILIINKFYIAPVNFFFGIFFLFHLENHAAKFWDILCFINLQSNFNGRLYTYMIYQIFNAQT